MMSPKARFIAHPTEAAIHRSLVVSPPFLNAVDSALLQMIDTLTAQPAIDIQTASANWHKVAGASQFIKTLLTLGSVATVEKAKDDRSNLKPV